MSKRNKLESVRESVSNSTTIAINQTWEEEKRQKTSKGNDDVEILQLSKQIDERLEQKAESHNLSALNVKSILNHLIKSEETLTMLRKSMNGEETSNVENGLKLTRRKTKELTEKLQIRWPWTSPQKCFEQQTIETSPVENFVDIFDDDDDNDVDYVPDAGDVESESDEMASTSDRQSPCCSSSLLTEDVDLIFTKKRSKLSNRRKSPTLSSLTKNRRNMKKNFTSSPQSYETRSKKSLCGIPIEQLEAPLFDIRPDFDFDFSRFREKDEDYMNFLTSVLASDDAPKNGAVGRLDEEDSNDTEYNFCEDKEIVDGDELRLDKATKVSKKELRGLLNDLLQIYEDDVDEHEESETTLSFDNISPHKSKVDSQAQVMKRSNVAVNNLPVEMVSGEIGSQVPSLRIDSHSASSELVASSSSTITPTSVACASATDVNVIRLVIGDESTGNSASILCEDQNSLPILTPFEVEQLKEQLGKHVQLLAQTRFMAQCATNLETAKEFATQSLLELDNCRSSSKLGNASMFNVHNLNSAMDLSVKLTQLPNLSAKCKSDRITSWPKQLVEILVKSKCFAYPELFFRLRRPLSVPELKSKRRSPPFLQSEDILLALGYLQMHPLGSSEKTICEKIHEHLLPSRSSKTIQTRFLKKTLYNKTEPNIIQVVKNALVYPDFQRIVEPFDANLVSAPFYYPDEKQPVWLSHYVEKSTHVVKAPFVTKRVFCQAPVDDPNEIKLSGVLKNQKSGEEFRVLYDASRSRPDRPTLKFEILPKKPTPVVDVRPPQQQHPLVYVLASNEFEVASEKKTASLEGENQEGSSSTNVQEESENDDGKCSTSFQSESPESPILYVNIGTPPVELEGKCGDVNIGEGLKEKCSFTCRNSKERLYGGGRATKRTVEGKEVYEEEFRSPEKKRMLKKVCTESPTKKAIKFLNDIEKKRSAKAAAMHKKQSCRRISDIEKEKMVGDDVSPERTVNFDLGSSYLNEEEFRSPTPNSTTPDVKKKIRSKNSQRAKRKNVLAKAVLFPDERIDEDKWKMTFRILICFVNEALALSFLKNLRSGLFMHESQLKEFEDFIRQTPTTSTETFETLFSILNRQPTPHRSLAHALTIFLRSHQAASIGFRRLSSHRHQNMALIVLTKLKRSWPYLAQKQKSFMRNFIRRVKIGDVVDECVGREELRRAFAVDSPILWDEFRQLFDYEKIDNSSVDDSSFEYVDQTTLENGADEFEHVVLNDSASVAVDAENFNVATQRICTCSCHKGSFSIQSCICRIKFCDGRVYFCKSGRYVSCDVIRGSLSDLEKKGDNSIQKTPTPSEEFMEGTSIMAVNLENNEKIRQFLNVVDAIEEENVPEDVNQAASTHLQVSTASSGRRKQIFDARTLDDDDNSLSSSIFLRGYAGKQVMLEMAAELRSSENSVAAVDEASAAAGTEEVWTKEVDRFLMEELNSHGLINEACAAAASSLKLDRNLVKDRMQFLLNMLQTHVNDA